MPEHEHPRYAWRVTFEYGGGQVQKISQRRVEMASPPSHAREGYERHVGFWYELRDADDKVVYRRAIHNPIQVHYEVFSPAGSLVRRPIENPGGTFEIVVPELAGAPHLVLYGTPHPSAAPVGPASAEAARPPVPRVGTEPAREIARFNLIEGQP
jgi:hypothetical protein